MSCICSEAQEIQVTTGAIMDRRYVREFLFLKDDNDDGKTSVLSIRLCDFVTPTSVQTTVIKLMITLYRVFV